MSIEMISATEIKDYTPHGRLIYQQHPAKPFKWEIPKRFVEVEMPYMPFMSACPEEEFCDQWSLSESKNKMIKEMQELYFSDKTLIMSSLPHSSSSPSQSARVIKSITCEDKILQAFHCRFLLPDTDSDGNCCEKVTESVCVVHPCSATILADHHSDHHVTLPFNVNQAWPMETGVLFERKTANSHKIVGLSLHNTKSDTFPIWFSMIHPLGDLSPVICKSGSTLSYNSDRSQQIVFISDQPPFICVTYCPSTRLHSIHIHRKTQPEEDITYSELRDRFIHDTTTNNSTANISNKTVGSNLSINLTQPHATPGRPAGPGTPYLSLSSILSPSLRSPAVNPSLNATPSLRSLMEETGTPPVSRNSSIVTPQPRSQSHPFAVMSPSINSPASALPSQSHIGAQTRAGVELDEGEMFQPIRPDTCINHMWTDSYTCPGGATRAFISEDFCGVWHLCMLIPSVNQLRVIKISPSHSNKQSVIPGSTSCISARDACSLPDLNLFIVLDMDFNLQLYTGPQHVGMLYLPRLSTFHQSSQPTTPAQSRGVLASSRPASAQLPSSAPRHLASFNESSDEDTPRKPPRITFGYPEMISPVPAELNDSSQMLHHNNSVVSHSITSLHSHTPRGIIMKLSCGELVHACLPMLYSSHPLVSRCLGALGRCLPQSLSMKLLCQCYVRRQVSTDSQHGDNQSYWFFRLLLDLLGFPSPLIDEIISLVVSPKHHVDTSQTPSKRSRLTPTPSDHHWQNLDMSGYRRYASVLGLSCPDPSPVTTGDNDVKGRLVLDDSGDQETDQSHVDAYRLDKNSPLYSSIHSVFIILHQVYQELKLDTTCTDSSRRLSTYLLLLASLLSLPHYSLYYLINEPRLTSTLANCSITPIAEVPQAPAWFAPLQNAPPCVFSIVSDLLSRKATPSRVFLLLPQYTTRAVTIITLVHIYVKKLTSYSELSNPPYIQMFPIPGRSAPPPEPHNLDGLLHDCNTTHELMLFYMHLQGIGKSDLETIPFGYLSILNHVISVCKENANMAWPDGLLRFIDREVLQLDPQVHSKKSAQPSLDVHISPNTVAFTGPTEKLEPLTGFESLDRSILTSRWPDDLRIEEVKRCLISSLPAKITLTQKPEVSDHSFFEERQKHLLVLCQRTLALPIGRGMVTLGCKRTVLAEALQIPPISLSGKSLPGGTSVELPSDAGSNAKLATWPAFHNGVAAGLNLDMHADIDSTWILFNRPAGDDPIKISEHAGFLMALGINGHLHSLHRLFLHDYLIKGHEMTAIGLLLGISVNLRGTMNSDAVRLLAIHIPPLLPTTTTQLNFSHNARTAALLGVGLLYHGSAYRHMVSTLLSEIQPSTTHTKETVGERESYSLTAGLALGMTLFSRGTEILGLLDLAVANQLYLLMSGGHKTQEKARYSCQSSSNGELIHEGSYINTDVTSAGATVAFGLIYFNRDDARVCEWLKTPDSQYLLDLIRPDLLQIRVISLSLVMWDKILPDKSWINSHIPEVVFTLAFKRPPFHEQTNLSSNIDYETMSQAYCYLLSGACFSIGLKFAGTSNAQAYRLLLEHVREFISISNKANLVDQAGKYAIDNTLCTCLLAAAMVMAGSGDLEILRICRYLRTRIGMSHSSLYGSHMAVHMSMGLLFLGGGRYTLSSKPDNIPVLLAAFYPRFPIHSSDNRYHLQAMRHLYVLACEPRLLTVKDFDSGQAISIPVEISLKSTEFYDKHTYRTRTACMLPELEQLESVRLEDEDYWQITFNTSTLLDSLRSGFVHKRAVLMKSRDGASSSREGGRAAWRTELRNLLEAVQNEQLNKITGSFSIQQLVVLVLYSKANPTIDYDSNLVNLIYKCLRKGLLRQLDDDRSLHQLVKFVAMHDFVPDCESVLQYLALHPDIRPNSVSHGLSLPELMLKLHLPLQVAKSAQSSLGST